MSEQPNLKAVSLTPESPGVQEVSKMQQHFQNLLKVLRVSKCIDRSLHALPFLLNDEVAKATMLLHTRPAQQNEPEQGG